MVILLSWSYVDMRRHNALDVVVPDVRALYDLFFVGHVHSASRYQRQMGGVSFSFPKHDLAGNLGL